MTLNTLINRAIEHAQWEVGCRVPDDPTYQRWASEVLKLQRLKKEVRKLKQGSTKIPIPTIDL